MEEIFKVLDLEVSNKYKDNLKVVKDLELITADLFSLTDSWQTLIENINDELSYPSEYLWDRYLGTERTYTLQQLRESGYEQVGFGAVGIVFKKTIEDTTYAVKVFIAKDYQEDSFESYADLMNDGEILEELQSISELAEYYPKYYGGIKKHFVVEEFIEGESMATILDCYKETVEPTKFGNDLNCALMESSSELFNIVYETIEKSNYIPQDLHLGNVIFRNNIPTIIDVGNFSVKIKGACEDYESISSEIMEEYYGDLDGEVMDKDLSSIVDYYIENETEEIKDYETSLNLSAEYFQNTAYV